MTVYCCRGRPRHQLLRNLRLLRTGSQVTGRHLAFLKLASRRRRFALLKSVATADYAPRPLAFPGAQRLRKTTAIPEEPKFFFAELKKSS